MVYANRKATRAAIRMALERNAGKHSTPQNDGVHRLETSVEWNALPKRNEKAGISAKNFRNANGAELIYK